MRIEHNRNGENRLFFMRDKDGKENAEKAEKLSGKTSFYAGEWNLGDDKIQQKKKQAQSMAMKLVSETFSNDRSVDEDLENRRNRVKDLQKENAEHQEMLEDIAKQKENLAAEYGVEDGIENMAPETKKEYQQRLMELERNEKEFKKQISDNTKEIVGENAAVREIKIELLKHHEMVDAQNQADDIMEAASKEIIGMLMDEAKENVDEKMEETTEKAEEAKEKKEEQEAKLEEAKKEEENQDEMYNLSKEMNKIKKSAEQENTSDIQKSVEQIVGELMLTMEDVKGAVVDTDI